MAKYVFNYLNYIEKLAKWPDFYNQLATYLQPSGCGR